MLGSKRTRARHRRDLHQALSVIDGKNSSVLLSDTPTAHEASVCTSRASGEDLHANELKASIDRAWRITSYSGLVKQGSHGASHDATIEVSGFDIDSADEQDESELIEPERSIFTFPRGARPGTFLHTLFEDVEFTEPATSEHNTQVITHLLRVRTIRTRVVTCASTTGRYGVEHTALDGKSLKLSEKDSTQRLVEMEFLLPIEVLAASELNQTIQYHDPLSAKAGDLGFQTVQGMLKGFIDLVFLSIEVNTMYSTGNQTI